MKTNNHKTHSQGKSRDDFLSHLEKVIKDRKKHPVPGSYTCGLFNEGIKKITQKVGEETTELIIEAMDDNLDRLKNETADLIYHLLVLLVEKGLTLDDVIEVLQKRHQ